MENETNAEYENRTFPHDIFLHFTPNPENFQAPGMKFCGTWERKRKFLSDFGAIRHFLELRLTFGWDETADTDRKHRTATERTESFPKKI